MVMEWRWRMEIVVSQSQLLTMTGNICQYDQNPVSSDIRTFCADIIFHYSNRHNGRH